MAYIIISFFAALIAAGSVFAETASLGLAFLTYASTGSLVLLTMIGAAALLRRSHNVVAAT